ncbi:MAG TPA: DUF4013 domain-containing protein, partial [Methanocella sp.]
MKALRSALRWHREGAESIVAASDYAFSMERWLISGLLFTLGIVSIVGLPAIFGYLHRCFQESVKCCATPPRFDRVLADYVEGLKIFFLMGYYFFVIVIIIGYIFNNLSVPVPGPVGDDT